MPCKTLFYCSNDSTFDFVLSNAARSRFLFHPALYFRTNLIPSCLQNLQALSHELVHQKQGLFVAETAK